MADPPGADGRGEEPASSEADALRAEVAALRAEVARLKEAEAERQRAEELLHEERRTLEVIFRTSPAAMVLWRGPDFVFDLVNPEYQRIFGDRPLVGLPLLEALPELADQPFPELLRRVFETGEPYVGKEVLARLIPRSGASPEDRYYDFTYARVDDAQGQPLGVYDHAVDVTSRVLARRRMEQAQDELRRAVQDLERERELRERFVATLSHDLRSPLSVVRLGIERFLRAEATSASMDSEGRRALGARLLRSVERIDRMVQDLLDANTLDAGGALTLELQACDLRALAVTTIEDLAAVHGDRFVLEASAPLEAVVDPRYMRRVIENLSTNAVKYGAERSPVTLGLERVDGDVSLSVHNLGPPIPAADQARIFGAFQRGGGPRPGGALGWGLGLLLVRGVVEAHGGEVSLVSSAELGTTFSVRLPDRAPAARVECE